MKRLARHVALLALAGAMGVAAPAIAAPNGPGMMGGQGNGNAPNCTGPAANSPACMKGKPKQHMKPGSGMGNNNNGNNNMTPGKGNMNPGMGNPQGPKGPPGPGMGSKMGPDHHMGPSGFDAFRRSFRFPHFAPPPFSARRGFMIPHGYQHSLRPLPPQFFGYYPMYRGFLFFETPDGQIVIVDPRTFRIVAII